MTTQTLISKPANRIASALSRAAARHQLMTVHWEITYRCNTRCTHCYAVKPGDPGFHAPAPEMTTQECFQVIDQLAEAGAFQIVFSGGEILVRPDFFAIASYARQKGFLLRLLTNGTLVTEETADKLARLSPMSIEISLYGIDAATHDGITMKPGSHAKVMRALELLKERGLRTVVKVPVMHENAGEISDIKAWAKTMGLPVKFDTMIVAKDNGDLTPLGHRLSDSDLLEFFDGELSAEFQLKAAGPDDKHCFSGMHTMAIDPYGEVFPCIQTRHSAGNVRHTSVKDIWTSAASLNFMRSVTIGSFPVCSSCELKGLCNRCPGNTEVEHGNFLGPNPEACRQSYLRYKVLQKKGALPSGSTPLPATWKIQTGRAASSPDPDLEGAASPIIFITSGKTKASIGPTRSVTSRDGDARSQSA